RGDPGGQAGRRPHGHPPRARYRAGGSRGPATGAGTAQRTDTTPMTRLLITNDDGIDSPGLWCLAGTARDAGLDVVVAAPHQEASGASASITIQDHEGRIKVEARELAALPGVPAYAVVAPP